MSSLEERLAALEESNNDLKLQIHAAKVAITTLSVCLNGMAGDKGALASAFEKGMEAPHWQNFETDDERRYQEELTKQILPLLAASTD
ncbi:hypothetical protein [Serratia marcescens]|uniref:hypothetical protein n=1 Tax=Serratia marcescens TaxID=615 RepID=UPI0011AB2DAC|nr:hypothetical protein [Serratia marcescens]